MARRESRGVDGWRHVVHRIHVVCMVTRGVEVCTWCRLIHVACREASGGETRVMWGYTWCQGIHVMRMDTRGVEICTWCGWIHVACMETRGVDGYTWHGGRHVACKRHTCVTSKFTTPLAPAAAACRSAHESRGQFLRSVLEGLGYRV